MALTMARRRSLVRLLVQQTRAPSLLPPPPPPSSLSSCCRSLVSSSRPRYGGGGGGDGNGGAHTARCIATVSDSVARSPSRAAHAQPAAALRADARPTRRGNTACRRLSTGSRDMSHGIATVKGDAHTEADAAPSAEPRSPADMLQEMRVVGQRGDTDACHLLFDALAEAGHPPGAEEYNALVKAYAQRGHTKAIHKLMARMRRAGIHPTADTYQHLFKSFSGAAATRGLEATWSTMEADGVQPTPGVFLAIIRAFAAHKQTITAAFFYTSMEAACGPSLEALAVLARGFAEAGDPAQAELMLQKAAEAYDSTSPEKQQPADSGSQHTADAATWYTQVWEAALLAHALSGNAAEWQRLSQRAAVEARVPINVHASELVLMQTTGAPQTVLRDRALDLLSCRGADAAEGAGTTHAPLTHDHIRIITRTLARAQLPGAVLEVIQALATKGRPVMLSYFHDFLHAHNNMGTHASPLDPAPLFRQLQQHGLEPNSVTFCLLMEHQVAHGNGHAAVDLCTELRARGLKQTGWANQLLHRARKLVRVRHPHHRTQAGARQ